MKKIGIFLEDMDHVTVEGNDSLFMFHGKMTTFATIGCEDVEFKDAISDERGALVDECLVSARVLALGIPEKDKDGYFVGWRERPDGYMIRYLLSTLGKSEGFGEESEDADIPTDIEHGINIDSWIKDKQK